MTGGPAAIDAGIEADRGLQAFVAEKLADGFVVAGLDLKNGFRAQVPELMRCQLNPRPLAQIGLDQKRDHRLAFRPAIGVHKNPLRPPPDHIGCDAVTILDQHLCNVRRDVERELGLVLDLIRRNLQ